MKTRTIKPIVPALLSAALLSVAWPPLPTAFLLFIALAPLLVLHHLLKDRKRRFLQYFLYTYLCFFIFNLASTWWVWNASPSGCLIMLFANSLILSLPFLMYAFTEKVMPRIAFFSFIVYYLSMEYFHFNWNAAWPWLTLGKGFASLPWYIQWYEFTGELGGSLLILTSNVFLTQAFLAKNYKLLWKPLALTLGMGLLSALCYTLNQDLIPPKINTDIHCVIAQPNIDPFEEKFGDGPDYIYPDIQLEYALDPAAPFIDQNTDLLLLPETALVGFNNVKLLNSLNLFEPLRILSGQSKISIIAGAETFKIFDSSEQLSATARFDKFSEKWFDSYNTAVLVKDSQVRDIYHKAKLVAGVEKMPFAFLEKLSINLGGSSGSLGSSDKPVNFTLNNGIQVAPLICYESIFGDYASEFVKGGAQVLAVITNDGWWGNSPGYTQHLQYGTIRCIETRREMIRSANTGISAKINRFGYIEKASAYNEKVAFACTARPLSKITFYVEHGNLIGHTASVLAVMLMLTTWVRLLIKK